MHQEYRENLENKCHTLCECKTLKKSYSNVLIKIKARGAEMAQWVRGIYTTSAEALGLVPSTDMRVFTTAYN